MGRGGEEEGDDRANNLSTKRDSRRREPIRLIKPPRSIHVVIHAQQARQHHRETRNKG